MKNVSKAIRNVMTHFYREKEKIEKERERLALERQKSNEDSQRETSETLNEDNPSAEYVEERKPSTVIENVVKHSNTVVAEDTNNSTSVAVQNEAANTQAVAAGGVSANSTGATATSSQNSESLKQSMNLPLETVPATSSTVNNVSNHCTKNEVFHLGFSCGFGHIY